ncbi:MAG: Mg2+ and Co2+ transporter CorB [Thermoclostridium sp.]|nr:Mg2+ and Co2+ transporter CorB [Thermoclostridium sp.]
MKKVTGKHGKQQSLWAISVTIVSFFLSIGILFVSTGLFEKISPYWSFLVVLVIILIGVLSDLVGVAVTAADEKPFHAMASKKYPGARQAIKLIRNADKVSSICNDVIGDICSVISGTAGAAIVFRIFLTQVQPGWVEAAVGGLTAALTVGGKAFAKKYGMNNSNFIVYRVGFVISLFTLSSGKK